MPVRVNTRISESHNSWLDQRAQETSLSKSALINLAVENYINQTKVMTNMEEMIKKVDMLEELKLDIKMLKEKINQ